MVRRTVIIIKPDAVNRSLIGEILSRFEKKGLKIVGMKLMRFDVNKIDEHYGHHKEKPFFKELSDFMSSIPCVFMVLEGKDAVNVVRKFVGKTNGRDAEPGTIRGDYSMSTQSNVIHANGDENAAKIEIKRFFKDEELINYEKIDFNWLYASSEKSKFEEKD
ncbi:MAG: nucleoside-diphosphate kinase [Candidatus ainarchaeum sp.]|nr:nucleoside-diphosphate kinase [Candidatus ainarchaeum sp.]